MKRVMTYDFGTSSLKAAVVDHSGQILADANEIYPLAQPHSGWAEQDPQDLWDAAGRAGRIARVRAGLQPSDIDSVVFVAPWKGIIPISDAGEVLHDAIIWMDGRASQEAEALNSSLGRFVGTGQEYWPRLMWLKAHRPEVWAQARWLMGMTSYLKWMATGLVATERSDDFVHRPEADGGRRYADILAAAGLGGDLEKFPIPAPATAIVGPLTAAAASHLGLSVGTPVLGGFGDLPALTVGSGPLEVGAAHIYFGTSSWLAAVTMAGAHTDSPLNFDIDEHFSAALYPLQTGCLAYDWIVEQTYGAEKAHLHDDIQEFVNQQVAEVEAGSGNLLATHWLNGELPPLSKNAKGAFLNLTSLHDRRHMVRSVMESICYSHRTSIERFELATGKEIREITAVGGGASSSVWMQMLADVLQRVVVVPENPRYVGAIGAHYTSVVALGEAPDLSQVPRRTEKSHKFDPNPANGAVYARLYGFYLRIYPALAEFFDDLNDPKGPIT